MGSLQAGCAELAVPSLRAAVSYFALPKEAFQRYVVQDAFFLQVRRTSSAIYLAMQPHQIRMIALPVAACMSSKIFSSTRLADAAAAAFVQAFAKAYAFALTKVPDTAGVAAFHSLIGSVLEELQLHDDYARLWDVNLEQRIASDGPLPATRAYTSFLCRYARVELTAARSVNEHTCSYCPCPLLAQCAGCNAAEALMLA